MHDASIFFRQMNNLSFSNNDNIFRTIRFDKYEAHTLQFCPFYFTTNKFTTLQNYLLSLLHLFPVFYRTIPQQGNTAEIVLNVLHRNFLGVDEFLGMVSLPLRDFDVYERPKTK